MIVAVFTKSYAPVIVATVAEPVAIRITAATSQASRIGEICAFTAIWPITSPTPLSLAFSLGLITCGAVSHAAPLPPPDAPQAMNSSPNARLEHSAELGEGNPQRVLQNLDTDDNVLLVSHQPLVGSLISFLQHGHQRQPQPMHTASLAELEGDFPLAGLMNLVSVKNP